MNLKNSSNLVRALRLPFISASAFPFILGSLLARHNLNILNFLLGLISVAATHLSANLINDYADSQSGLDWQDRSFYKFFGGSKLIQEGVFSEKFYFGLSLFFAFVSFLCIIVLCLRLKNISIIGFYAIIIFFAWVYSIKPLQFSYHMAGEIIIFLMFGPALVMGGYFIQTGISFALNSFLLSLPFGFLTTAILFANEVPDFPDDKKGNKLTWVSLIGQEKSFILYSILMFLAFFSIGLSILFRYLSPTAILSFIFIFPALKAAKILKTDFGNKLELIESSKLTIIVHTFVSIVLIISLLL
jgi:1,4-dihydroxy-2-naphthoate octaprenyltransferase